MELFDYLDEEAIGTVHSVDTGTVNVSVSDVESLRGLQVNRLVALQSSKAGQHLIGLVTKITRKSDPSVNGDSSRNEEDDDPLHDLAYGEINFIKVVLAGTLFDRIGTKPNIFKRSLDTVPEIDAFCFPIEGERLTNFMKAISELSGDEEKLALGHYSLDENAEAFLNGNRFFQRHAVLVGSTGSGKSFATARMLEQVAKLKSSNAILFDIHGEYAPLGEGFISGLRIAGPQDLANGKTLDDGVLYLPYWLFGYEEIMSMLVDRSDQNAPNQAMVLSREIVSAKEKKLREAGDTETLENFTIDSPIPYDLNEIITELERLNTEMVPGSGNKEKQGDFHGKLSRLISRIRNKSSDRRLGFMFQGGSDSYEMDWLIRLAKALVGTKHDNGTSGVKVIDFSEVPSDILPLIASLVARIVFQIQQWMDSESRHPIAIFAEEAHLYIPNDLHKGISEVSLDTFERIAKEGRKYGVGLVIVSQRPSEVNRTVLSQCNNTIALRLTNAEDQAVVKRLLPETLGGLIDSLPVLDTGEAIVVGDSSLLPSKIRVGMPHKKPLSGTVDFWDEWSKDSLKGNTHGAVTSWRRQGGNS